MSSLPKVMIRRSAYDSDHLNWIDSEAYFGWPPHYVLRGGVTSRGDYFVFACSTSSHDFKDVAEAHVFYGTGDSLKLAEESAYHKYEDKLTLHTHLTSESV